MCVLVHVNARFLQKRIRAGVGQSCQFLDISKIKGCARLALRPGRVPNMETRPRLLLVNRNEDALSVFRDGLGMRGLDTATAGMGPGVLSVVIGPTSCLPPVRPRCLPT